MLIPVALPRPRQVLHSVNLGFLISHRKEKPDLWRTAMCTVWGPAHTMLSTVPTTWSPVPGGARWIDSIRMRNPDMPKSCPAITPTPFWGDYTHEEQKRNGNQSHILASDACTALSWVWKATGEHVVVAGGQGKALHSPLSLKSQKCWPLVDFWGKEVKEKRKKKLAKIGKSEQEEKGEREEEAAEEGGGGERKKMRKRQTVGPTLKCWAFCGSALHPEVRGNGRGLLTQWPCLLVTVSHSGF